MENTNPKGSQKPNVKMIGIILAIVVVIILAVVIINSGNQNTPSNDTNNAPVSGEVTPGTVTPGTVTSPVATITTESGQVIPEGSRVEVVGANPIKDNIVITKTGEVAKNDIVPMSPGAPQQTPPMAKADLPKAAIKLDASLGGFSPASFEVKAGAVVTLSLSSADDITHVFMFDDQSLSAVAIGVSPSETRAITFNAPTKAGEYTFRCDVPGHSGRGEVGKMIVK